MIGLTARQQDALRFIQGFLEAKGYSPSFAEIAAGIGARSKSPAGDLVNSLERRGAVRRLHHRARAIEVIHPVPIARAPDGAPLFAVAIGPGA